MQTIVEPVSNEKYYLFTEIANNNSNLVVESEKKFLEHYQVPHEKYTYAKKTKGEWVIEKKKKKYCQLLIQCEYYCNHIAPTTSFLTWIKGCIFPSRSLEVKNSPLKLPSQSITVDELALVTAGKISCIYLFSLGQVSQLRDSMKISDDIDDEWIVYKYGRTNNLIRRNREHITKYQKITNVELNLAYYAPIDPYFLVEAEGKLASIALEHGLSIPYLGSRELIALSPQKLTSLKKKYDTISTYYLRLKKDDLMQEMVLKKEIQLLEKEIEILQLKLTLSENY